MAKHKQFVSSIRPCGILPDVPNRWVPPVRRDLDLGLPPNASRLDKFISALRALVKDMLRKETRLRTVALQDGVIAELDGRNRGYCFPFEGDAELFEGARVTIHVGSRTCDGTIASISSQWLIISLAEDFGPAIAACVLRIDNTAMIEALADRLEKARSGEARLNHSIADEVLDNSGDQAEAPLLEPHQVIFGELNSHQKMAVHHTIFNRVTYLWGPPGTGKTQTLGVINERLFAAGKRVLLCSNTNQAVDQVLTRLCENFGLSHPALIDGKFLRIGKSEGIPERFTEYLTLDGIVRRKSVDLQKRKLELQDAAEKLRAHADSSRHILEQFLALDRASQERAVAEERRQKLDKASATIIAQQAEVLQQFAALERELSLRANAGPLRRLLMRNEEIIKRDMAQCDARRNNVKAMIRDQQRERDNPELTRKLEKVSARYNALAESLHRYDRADAESIVSAVETKVASLLREIANINVKLDSIAQSIIAGARIVGATVTKAFLSPQQFGNFDTVIVDEASMVILPALYYVCGLAKEKVIISGDFRQLAPIVPTDEQAILETIGCDVFHAAGIPKAFSAGSTAKRTVMLAEQYRMKAGICDLISERMYEGRLVTSPSWIGPETELPAPFDGEMTIIDTSSIQPFVARFGSSRYNLMNAFAVRNLVRFLSEHQASFDRAELPGSKFTIGICTPFTAQKELLKRLVTHGEVLVGTVHRYQGAEKTAMIIDIPDSIGERFVSMFAQAGRPDDPGSQLFNVAVSRAKAHLIFVANLEYLDRKLPGDAFLRELLFTASVRGRVVDVRDVIAMWPNIEDWRECGHPLDFDPKALATGLFDRSSFDAVFRADLDHAKRGIAIYSPFVALQRVEAYEALFRRKNAEGIAIRCVTRPPAQNGSIPADDAKGALDSLDAMGCTVDTRGEIHQPVVVVDDEIIWFGSLNPLSHTGRTNETMLRVISKPGALQMAVFLSVTGNRSPDHAEGRAFLGENPKCPGCKARTTYRMGKSGPYWECESRCGWTEGLKPNRAQRLAAGNEDRPTNAPTCPKCKAQTVLRRGRYGKFWSCSRFPVCDGLVREHHERKPGPERRPAR